MDTVWISAREAAGRLGVSPHNLPRIAEANRLRIWSVPPMKTRYHASDVDALVASSVRVDGRRRELGAAG